MSVTIEAAYHEAGHAIIAHRSRFHRVVGPINLASYGSGESFIALSRSKCAMARKAPDATAQCDPEVATDLAIVLSAGLVAERVAQKHDGNIRPNPGCAFPDHALLRQQLQGAGLPPTLDQHEAKAEQALESQWALLRDLAQMLFQNEAVGPETIEAFIEQYST